MSIERKRKQLIIPVFIPYQGCPHKCIYCRQDKITNQAEGAVHSSDVVDVIEQAKRSHKFLEAHEREVAFYGGTFTSLGDEKIKELLGAVEPYIAEGDIDGIRVSTRPDRIDRRVLALIKEYGVVTVELGVQSMDDDILKNSKRGHTAEDTVNAISLLEEYGFTKGVQLMPGLPGDSESGFRSTIDRVIRLEPDICRLYPAIVIKDTELARMYYNKQYTPLSLDEAVKICSESCIRLEQAGINVIKIGLMSSPSLIEEGQIVAGPWHDAFGYLVRSDIYHRTISRLLPEPETAGEIGIRMPGNDIPLLRGYQNMGIRRLEDMCMAKIIYVKPDSTIDRGNIEVDVIK